MKRRFASDVESFADHTLLNEAYSVVPCDHCSRLHCLFFLHVSEGQSSSCSYGCSVYVCLGVTRNGLAQSIWHYMQFRNHFFLTICSIWSRSDNCRLSTILLHWVFCIWPALWRIMHHASTQLGEQMWEWIDKANLFDVLMFTVLTGNWDRADATHNTHNIRTEATGVRKASAVLCFSIEMESALPEFI